MTGLIVCLALAAAITLAALIGDRVRELRATADLLLIDEDAADDRTQQAAMSDDEIARMREDEAMALANESRIGPATAAHIYRHQLEDDEALRRWLA